MNKKMKVMSRLLFAAISVAGFVLPARADVSGFEHLLEISIDCGKAPGEAVKPQPLGRFYICTYEHRLCKVFSKSKLEFEAYISVDCEVKAATDACPPIDACAKPSLKPEVADAVHQKNDPNFTGSADGATSGTEGAAKGKR